MGMPHRLRRAHAATKDFAKAMLRMFEGSTHHVSQALRKEKGC
jgi:hypothetical protein